MPAMYSTWFSRPPVARPGQAVVGVFPAGGVDGCGSGPGREVVAVGEAGHVRDVGQYPCRPGRPDAVDVHQVRPGRLNRCLRLDLHRLELDVGRRSRSAVRAPQ